MSSKRSLGCYICEWEKHQHDEPECEGCDQGCEACFDDWLEWIMSIGKMSPLVRLLRRLRHPYLPPSGLDFLDDSIPPVDRHRPELDGPKTCPTCGKSLEL